MKKFRSLSLDAKKTLRGKFDPSRVAEQEFYKSLKQVAKASADIINKHAKASPAVARLTGTARASAEIAQKHILKNSLVINERAMMKELNAYAQKLTPWAMRQSAKLLATVENSNKRAYNKKSKTIGGLLREGVGENNVGRVARALMAEQVELIKSIPIESGQRAQKIAFEASLAGTRAAVNEDTVKELQEQLGLTQEVAESRAMLIARTEVARSNASINQARAVSVGSRQYRWRNSGDGAVRESHRIYQGRRLDGRIFSWDSPPTLSDGMTGHPGTFPNCRCYAEPVFDD